ncbi:Uncharacterised protein [Citrobacter koseri]|nr:Uncharacterised protein [Citrobacter koseri]
MTVFFLWPFPVVIPWKTGRIPAFDIKAQRGSDAGGHTFALFVVLDIAQTFNHAVQQADAAQLVQASPLRKMQHVSAETVLSSALKRAMFAG